MTHVNINYAGDNSGRRAICDLIRWFGLRRSILIIRKLKACKTLADLDRVDMVCCFGGVQGEPVRRLIAYIHGERVLSRWCASGAGDSTLLRTI